jgi:hypothetical protein
MLDFLMDFLNSIVTDPVLYSFVFFIFVILAVVILPIPVEIGLFNPNMNPFFLILILALGKGIGSYLVFYFGMNIRDYLVLKFNAKGATKGFIKACEGLVMKLRYIGLFILLSIPFMSDTLVVYFFALLNKKKKKGRVLDITSFITVNVAAGFVRGIVVILVAVSLGMQYVSISW